MNNNNNIGGLFQYLNSETCRPYYAELTPENRDDILEKIMSDPVFLEAAQVFVSDIHVIRQKLDTKVGQMCKKMAEKAAKDAEAAAKLTETKAKPAISIKIVEDDDPIVEIAEEEVVEEFPEFDEEKGKYIGSGFYLKREDHLMKLTSPHWTFYY
jgi:hypothetical protein